MLRIIFVYRRRIWSSTIWDQPISAKIFQAHIRFHDGLPIGFFFHRLLRDFTTFEQFIRWSLSLAGQRPLFNFFLKRVGSSITIIVIHLFNISSSKSDTALNLNEKNADVVFLLPSVHAINTAYLAQAIRVPESNCRQFKIWFQQIRMMIIRPFRF